jgi:hypothetical protein
MPRLVIVAVLLASLCGASIALAVVPSKGDVLDDGDKVSGPCGGDFRIDETGAHGSSELTLFYKLSKDGDPLGYTEKRVAPPKCKPIEVQGPARYLMKSQRCNKQGCKFFGKRKFSVRAP